MIDREFIERACTIAAASAEPVKCGAVVVSGGGVVISEAFNSQTIDKIAINHAEIKALIDANLKIGSRKLTGMTVYCSCEPCAMCLTALSYASIQRIVYHKSMKDLFPRDPQSNFDSISFINGLNFVPRLEQLN